ncbi:MAG: acetylxylan esterase [Clostridia bacterium]|nr:acetylxylan esterase [Clostridia bacterium]
MREYKDLYTEEIQKAAPYRQNYLKSVLRLAYSESKKVGEERKEYITPKKLKENRAKYVSDFKKIIGKPLFDRSKKCDVQKIFVGIDEQGYIYRLVFEFEKDIKFCGLLFVPFDAKEKLSLITVLHGGDGTPELISDMYGENYYSHITRRIIDRRAVVFAPQLLIWDGKRFGDKFERFTINSRFEMLGGSLTAFECECMMGALDYLSKSDYVDSERIGITGLSYGGYYSLVMAVLDERIKSVYSSCVYNDRVKYSRVDFVYRDMAKKFLDAEMTALISPRALYIEAGKNDLYFNLDGAQSEYERLKEYYIDNPSKLVFKATDTGHKYDETDDGIEFLFNNL